MSGSVLPAEAPAAAATLDAASEPVGPLPVVPASPVGLVGGRGPAAHRVALAAVPRLVSEEELELHSRPPI